MKEEDSEEFKDYKKKKKTNTSKNKFLVKLNKNFKLRKAQLIQSSD